MGAKVKTLPANLFKNCSFESFVFEETSSCTKIEKGFTNYAISNVTIPKTVKELSLAGFDPLTVKLEEGNPYYLYIDYCLIRKEDHTLISALHKNFVIPTDGSVTRIAKCAFTNWDITSIYIPDVITEIEEGAFNDCINLKSLSLPFIGTSRDESCMLAVLFGTDHYYGAVEVLSGVAGTPSAVYYYVPATLRELTFRGTVLQSNAFSGLEKITTLKLSTSVQSIGKDLLKPCALYLKEIHYEGSEESFDALNANSWLYYTYEDTVFVYNAEIH